MKALGFRPVESTSSFKVLVSEVNLHLYFAWAEWRLRKSTVQAQVELLEAAVALLRHMPRLPAPGEVATEPDATAPQGAAR